MSNLRRLVILAGLLPILGLVVALFMNSTSNWQTINASSKVSELAELVKASGELAHELQKERGMGAGFLSGSDDAFLNTLNAQRAKADAKIAAFNAVLNKDWSKLGGKLSPTLDELGKQLAGRPAMQRRVNERAASVRENVGFYTSIIEGLIDVTRFISAYSTDSDLSVTAGATRAFLMAKEKAGLERAIGSVLFNQGMANTAAYKTYVTLVAAQNAYLDEYRSMIGDEGMRLLENTVRGEEVDEVLRRRQVLLDLVTTGDTQGLAATEWFALATTRINLMKQIEDQLLSGIIEEAQAINSQAWRDFLFIGGLILGLIVASLVFSAFIRQRVVALQKAEAAAQQAARDKEKETMKGLAERFQSTFSAVIEALVRDADHLRSTAHSMNASAERGQEESTNVTATFGQTSENVQMVATATDQLSSSIEEISKQLGHSSAITSQALERTRETDHTVNELAAAAQKIGDVVSMISEIAEQTNLLALNATIEAARAGEAGKGFAVVAQEVKNLAAQTTSATEQIVSQIGSVQSVSDQTVHAVKTLRESFEEINNIMSSVSSAVEEQGAATANIAGNTQDAAHGTDRVFDSLDVVRSAASDTGRASLEVMHTIESFVDQAKKIDTEARSFVERLHAA